MIKINIDQNKVYKFKYKFKLFKLKLEFFVYYAFCIFSALIESLFMPIRILENIISYYIYKDNGIFLMEKKYPLTYKVVYKIDIIMLKIKNLK